jgi:homoserine dehydrogenase
LRQVNIALAGFGAVGRELVKIVMDQAETLQEQHGVSLRFTALADSSGAVYLLEQALLPHLVDWKESGRGLGSFHNAYRSWSMGDFVAQAEVLVELGPTDLQTGQPSLERIRWALSQGRHVVTGNKGPLALDFSGIMQMAQAAGVQLKYSAAVCGGLPVLATARGLTGSAITGFEGILGATPNHILARMEADGLDYQAALALTKALGIAERDARLDVEGWDTAAKTVILANALLGSSLRLQQVPVTGITDISPFDLTLARQKGGALKLIGWARRRGDQVIAGVEPRVLPPDHPLAGVTGAAQAVTIESSIFGPLTLSGGPSSPRVAAGAVLKDLLHLAAEVPENVVKGS